MRLVFPDEFSSKSSTKPVGMSLPDHFPYQSQYDKTITKPHILFLTLYCNLLIMKNFEFISSFLPEYRPARTFIRPIFLKAPENHATALSATKYGPATPAASRKTEELRLGEFTQPGFRCSADDFLY